MEQSTECPACGIAMVEVNESDTHAGLKYQAEFYRCETPGCNMGSLETPEQLTANLAKIEEARKKRDTEIAKEYEGKTWTGD